MAISKSSIGGDTGVDIPGPVLRVSWNGTRGNDTYLGTRNNDIAFGHAGNDTLEGGVGNDSLFGGVGDDVLHGDSDSSKRALHGNDAIYGDAGDDALFDGNGSDTLYGGDDRDFLYTSNDNAADYLYGGSGDDVISVYLEGQPLTSGEIYDGGDGGTDTFYLERDVLGAGGPPSATSRAIVDLASGFIEIDGNVANISGMEELHLRGDNLLVTATDASERIYVDKSLNGTGTEIGSTVYGGGGNDTIDTGDSQALVYGGDGNDQLRTEFFSMRAVEMYGGNGNDRIETENGADIVDGGEGHDNIDTGRNDDIVNGGGGNDVINAGDGNDIVEGGAGDDTISGYSGNDIVYGGDGNDTLYTDDFSDDPVKELYGGAGDDVINSSIANFVYDGHYELYGGEGNDTIYATTSEAALIDGGDGDDRLYGGLGDDRITGGDGNDFVNAGVGDDSYFDYGSGDDTVFGGAGFDEFVLNGTYEDFDIQDLGGGSYIVTNLNSGEVDRYYEFESYMAGLQP